jgi:hypothetical protein
VRALPPRLTRVLSTPRAVVVQDEEMRFLDCSTGGKIPSVSIIAEAEFKARDGEFYQALVIDAQKEQRGACKSTAAAGVAPKLLVALEAEDAPVKTQVAKCAVMAGPAAAAGGACQFAAEW